MKKIIVYFLFLMIHTVGCKGQPRKAGEAGQVPVKSDTISTAVAVKPIVALFRGTDKKSELKYTVQVVFYPTGEKAILTNGAHTYVLTQYVTADGYGYKNEALNLRGKGREATMTFKDQKTPVIYLTESE